MTKEIIVSYKNHGNKLVIIDQTKFKNQQSRELIAHIFIAMDNNSFHYEKHTAVVDTFSYLDPEKWGPCQPTIIIKSPDLFDFEDGMLKLGSIPINDFPPEALPVVKGFIESKYIFPMRFFGSNPISGSEDVLMLVHEDGVSSGTEREQAYLKALKEAMESCKKEKAEVKKEVTPLQEFFNNPGLHNVDFSFAPNLHPTFLQITAKQHKEDSDFSYLRIAFSDPLEIVIRDTPAVDYPNCKRVSIALPKNSCKRIVMESAFPCGCNFRLTNESGVHHLFSAVRYLKFDMLERTWEAEGEKILLYLEGLASVINGIYNPRKLIEYLDAVDASE